VKGITTAALAPGAFFDAPVYLDQGFILVSPDVSISAELLARLATWGYDVVYTDGEPVAAPSYLSQASGGSKVSSLEEDIRERQRAEQSHSFLQEFTKIATEIYAGFLEKNTLDAARLTDAVKRAVGTVKSNRSTILRFGEGEGVEPYLVGFSVNTCLLAVAIGDFLKLAPHKILELGIAAFLHDIGMTKVSPAIMTSGKPLTAEEKKTMMYHTIVGYRLLRAFNLSEEVALAALEHHERIDGSGYPRRVPPDKLSASGRIVAVACSYVAATSRRKYKAPRDGHGTIREMLGRKQYDAAAAKALLYTLGLYPLGSYVVLSNQAQGIVVDVSPTTPQMPSVQMLLDPEGNPVTKVVIVSTAGDGGVAVSRPLTRQESERLRAKLGK
jgi:HD-GYP domain-containing protein (c-di-GMP phosphodiesterase class II)